MFSLQQGNELVFQTPSNSNKHPTIIRQDLNHRNSSHPPTSTHSSTDKKNNSTTRKRGRQLTITGTGDRRPNPKKEESIANKDDNNDDDDDEDNQGGAYIEKKKMIHRDIEKQRRQDMAKLYSSLRSLLPLEFIKGKRSIPDHMQQAVNYIKHMQQNIKHLNVKRHDLKNMSNNCTRGFSGEKNNTVIARSSNNQLVPNTVTLSPSPGGAQILINSGYQAYQPEFLLSRLIRVLYQHRHNVVSYTSTKVNERLLLTIQSEVSDLTSSHLSVLQQKLSEVVHA